MAFGRSLLQARLGQVNPAVKKRPADCTQGIAFLQEHKENIDSFERKLYENQQLLFIEGSPFIVDGVRWKSAEKPHISFKKGPTNMNLSM